MLLPLKRAKFKSLDSSLSLKSSAYMSRYDSQDIWAVILCRVERTKTNGLLELKRSTRKGPGQSMSFLRDSLSASDSYKIRQLIEIDYGRAVRRPSLCSDCNRLA